MMELASELSLLRCDDAELVRDEDEEPAVAAGKVRDVFLDGLSTEFSLLISEDFSRDLSLLRFDNFFSRELSLLS